MLTKEDTVAGDVANVPVKMLGKPLFKVSSDLFYKIGFTNRNAHGWYEKFYGSEMCDWCRANKGKKFTIKNEDNEMYIDCEVK